MDKKRTLHAIGNAHIDPVWLWRWPEGLETIRATFRSALDRMKEYGDFVFTCSSSAFYSMLDAVEPEMVDEIRIRVQEGRWELVGGWWVEPDVNVPCGESLVRQGLYGQRYLQDRFGKRARIGYNPDTFGHPSTLPQILRSLGLTRYVFMRPGTHEKELPGHIFRWMAPDGSEVLTLRIARSYATWPEDIGEHVRACAAEAPAYVRDYAVFYGVGNHGGGPTKTNIESLHATGEVEPGFGVKLSSLAEFFARVEEEMQAGASVPVVCDELQHHARGCYSAHSGVKEGNSRTERLLMMAERMAVMAKFTCGLPAPSEELAEAWQALLFSQFHDILAGTSLPEAYEDARDAHGFASHIASRALHAALQKLAGQADTRGDGEAILLFNTLPWAVRMPVEIERGPAGVRASDGQAVATQVVQSSVTTKQRRTCVVAELPPMGFRVFYGTAQADPPSEPAGELSAADGVLQNAWHNLKLSSTTGLPDELYDRRSSAQLLRQPGMRLAVMHDPSDTWSHGVPAFRDEVGEFRMSGGPVIEESGPVRVSLRTHMVFGDSAAIHRLRLYRDLPVIDGKLSITWLERQKALKLCIPTSICDAEVAYEVPYGSITRPQDGEEHPGQHWADMSGGVQAAGSVVPCGLALLTESQYGYDAMDGELRVTLLRSPVYAHHDPTQLEAGVAYRYMDQGEHVIRYRLVPHLGTWRDADIPRRAAEFLTPALWVKEYAHSGPLGAEFSFLEVLPANVVAMVCKTAEDGDGFVVRAVETHGELTEATFAVKPLGIQWTAMLTPYKIATFRIRPGLSPQVREVNALEEPTA